MGWVGQSSEGQGVVSSDLILARPGVRLLLLSCWLSVLSEVAESELTGSFLTPDS